MKKFLPALLLALLAGCQPSSAQQAGGQQVLCSKSFTISAGATSIAQVVAGVANQSVHICGIWMNAGAAAATYQLTVGTGTNCNANTVNVTPAFSLGINGTLEVSPGVAFYSSPVGYAICHTITGTGPMNALVSYHQF